MLTRFIVVILFTVSMAGACLAQTSAPSLGELAKKTRAEKKAVMVFDDDNTVRSAPAVQASASAENSVAAESSKAKSSQDADKQSKKNQESKADPAALDAKVAELQKKLDTLKKNQGTWSNSAKSYEDKLATETDEFRRNTYQEAIDNDRNNAELYKKQIEQTQADLAKAQEAAAAAKQASQHQETGSGDSK
jgi:vancomycin resistance protein YoaR